MSRTAGTGAVDVVVTHHALRRWAERADRFAWSPPADLPDRDAVEMLGRLGYPVDSGRADLARMAEVGVRHDSDAVSARGMRLMLSGRFVTTCPRPLGHDPARRRRVPRRVGRESP